MLCENLHLSPLEHWPCLKNAQTTDFGSAPEYEIDGTTLLYSSGMEWNSALSRTQIQTGLKFNEVLISSNLLSESLCRVR